MQDGNKVYGFTLSLYEYPRTIPTLWDATKGETFPLSLEIYLLTLNCRVYRCKSTVLAYGQCDIFHLGRSRKVLQFLSL